jgi:hypothetical protein
MKTFYKYLTLAVLAAAAGLTANSFLAGQTPAGGHLIVYGDTVFFLGPGKALNCTETSRYKKGDPVGFRMTAIDPATGQRDRMTQMTVHITYDGKTVDVPMRDRQNEKQPERTFWVAKWVVPEDATPGVVKYTVSAKAPDGKMGEYKPFDVDASQLTIVE